MCTYTTAQVAVSGSGKGPADWVRVGRATVYLDHPVHAMAEHTLNIDLVDPDRGPGARVALELEPRSALALCEAIIDALAAVRPELSGIDPERVSRSCDEANRPEVTLRGV